MNWRLMRSGKLSLRLMVSCQCEVEVNEVNSGSVGG